MDQNVSPAPKCQRCGAPLAADAPAGLCPRCLMALNLATQTEAPGSQAGPEAAKGKPLPSLEDIARRFPQLEILECLGRGGMGVVYKARQPRLNRLVALKILASEREKDPRFAERFEREAQALARLSHPNIVTVHDFGEAGGLFYLLMEYVDGLNLRQLERARKMSPEEALAIVPPVCEALQYAHQQGIVHRDIKPENILLDKQGRVKIADFGIAKILGAESQQRPLTGEQQAVGTPHYMAPEQVEKPATVDHRADIYSLGVVLYEMLTGELPLGKFAPPSQKVQIDVRLDEVVLRALEKEPERRYQQASEVKTQVETIAASPAQPPGSSQREEVPFSQSAASRSLLTSASAEARLSRTAIVGAAWAPFAFLALWRVFNVQPVPASDYTEPAWWQVFFMITQPLKYTAPFGTTILGLVAAAQIRRSAGKLCGLGLALFDALLFPLLALDYLISLLGKGGYGIWVELVEGNSVAKHHFVAILVTDALVLLAIIAVDVLIIRQVWRAVSKPVQNAPPVPPGSARMWWLAGSACGLVLFGTFLLLTNFIPRSANKASAEFRNPTRAAPLAEPAAPTPKSESARTVMATGPLNPTRSDPSKWQVDAMVPEADIADVEPAQSVQITLDAFPKRVFKGKVAAVGSAPVTTQNVVAYDATIEVEDADPRFKPGMTANVSIMISNKTGQANLGPQKPPEQPVAELRFGPVIERVVKDGDTKRDCLIDLDAGKIFTAPDDLGPRVSAESQDAVDIAAAFTWLTEHGIDAMAEPGKGIEGLIGFSLKASPVANDMWDKARPEDVRALISRRTVEAARRFVLSGRGGLPKTFAFQTREGGRGILQITAITENPRGVKLRYKLLENRNGASDANSATAVMIKGTDFSITSTNGRVIIDSPKGRMSADKLKLSINSDRGLMVTCDEITFFQIQTNASNVQSPQQPNFGPVIERVIEEAVAPRYPWFDLDTGKSMASSDTFPSGSEIADEAVAAWRAKSGAEVAANLSEGICKLIGFDMIALPVNDDQWDRIAPSDLIVLLSVSKPSSPAVMSSKDAAPATYAFRTREGGTGILQITGFTDNPRGVMIRYKLVQAGTSTASPFSSSTSRTNEFPPPPTAPVVTKSEAAQPAAGQARSVLQSQLSNRSTNAPTLPQPVGASIIARDVTLNFADPIARGGTLHSQPRVSFGLDLHDQSKLPEGHFAVTTMLIGQTDFVLGLVGRGSLGTRVHIRDMSAKDLVDELWNNRSNRFEKRVFLPVDFNQKPYSCPVQLEFGRLDDGKLWGAYCFRAYLSGRVSLAGSERNFELVNLDRRIAFLKPGKDENPVDVLGVDINGDGKIDAGPDGGEIFNLDETFQVGAKHYRLAQADPLELKVAFQEVTEPDYVKAQDILRQSFGVAGAMDETMKKKDDLKLAQSLASRVVELLHEYNELVRGTPVELPKTNVDWMVGLANALQAGKWEEADSEADSGEDLTSQTKELENLAALQRARSFGPVIERVLPFKWKAGTSYCLDFESGELVAPPGRLSVVDSGWALWCAQRGVDATAEERKTGPVLWGQNCAFAKIENARWNTIKPARVVKELLIGCDVRLQAELPNRQAVPATFLFKTREGGRGVMQIVGFTEDLRGMKLRYKLVHP